MDPAWIGVIGAVVGALASYPVQAVLAKRADSAAQSKELRADRVAAYSSFAEKVMEWRRSQVIRRMLTIRPTDDTDAAEAIRDENRRARAAAWTTYYRVRLLCDDAAIEASALGVIQTTRAMKHAKDRPELNQIGDNVRRDLNSFLDIAAHQTSATAATDRTRTA